MLLVVFIIFLKFIKSNIYSITGGVDLDMAKRARRVGSGRVVGQTGHGLRVESS